MVYPRVCGGTYYAYSRILAEGGLSPRMRGNRARLLTELGYAGSIPAYAGEPRHYARAAVWGGVYPRVCGGT